MNINEFINKIAPIVQKYAPLYDINVCSPIIAQAVLESNYGNSELAKNAHNYFGIKYRKDRCPTSNGIYCKVGSEQNADGSYVSSSMNWCKFPDMDACVQGYFDFTDIKNYANLKGVTDPKTYLINIKNDGYATSLKYVDNLMRVIETNNLTRFDKNVENSVAKIIEDKIEDKQEVKQMNIEQKLANRKNYGSMRNVSTIKYIVIHYTANDGDTATANGNYFKNKVITASAHYFVDDNKIIQSVPDNYVAYAVGGKKLNNKAKLHGIAKNANTLNIELCDTIKNGVIYPSEATIAQAVELTKLLMQKYNIPVSNVIRHQDVTGKKCPAYWSDDTKWQNEFKARLTSAAPATTTNNTVNTVNVGDANIEKGQQYSINFTGHKIATDGKRGPDSKEQAVRVVQHALNLDYNAKLLEDGQWGNKTDKAFGKHYVAKGEKQYLVTAAEILCYLMAKNPNGVEYPGSYGKGLASATGKTRLDINWFKGACS